MKYKIVVLLTFLTLLTTPVFAIFATGEDVNVLKVTSADAPEWRVGDSWVYDIDVVVKYYDELQLDVDLDDVRFEVTGSTDTEYQVGLSGSADATGAYGAISGGMDNGKITGGTVLIRKSDLAITGLDAFKAEGKASVLGIPTGISCSGTFSLNELTPISYLEFPMDVGNTWNREAVVGFLPVVVDVGSIIHEDVAFNIYQVPNSYSCAGMESISVGSSSFECYKIVGDMGTSSTLWYSPDIGNLVKAQFRDIDLYFEEGNELHYDIDSIDITCTGYGKVSDPPETPSAPSGPSKGDLGETYSFSATSTDPDGDKIKYVFDWGDEKTSETNFVDSGQAGSASHKWNNGGQYEVRVKAVDINGAESDWSGPSYIDIEGTRGSVNLTIKIIKVAEQQDIDPWYKFGADWTYKLSVYNGDGWITRQYDCPSNKNTYEPNKEYTFPVQTGSPEIKLKLWDRDVVIKNPLGGYIDYHDLADVSSYNGNGESDDLNDKRGAIYHGVYDIGKSKLQTTISEDNDYVDVDGSKYITSGRLDGSMADDRDTNDARIIFKITDDYEPLKNARITYPADGAVFYEGQEINFKASVEKGLMPYKWEWDFGDGTTSNKQSPTKVYSQGGNDYFVKVKVTDEAGTSVESAKIKVRVSNNYAPATPDKPSGPTSPKIGASCIYKTFARDNENDGMEFGWDWDDDGVVDEWDNNNGKYYYNGDFCETPHTWDEGGIQKLKVKVKDETGLESGWSDVLTIRVKKTRSLTLLEKLFALPVWSNILKMVQEIISLNLS